MKKKVINIILITLIGLLTILDLNCSFSLPVSNSITEICKTKDVFGLDLDATYEVIIDNVSHEINIKTSHYVPENRYVWHWKISVYIDGKVIYEYVNNYLESLDFDNIPEFYDIKEDNFIFIKGMDNKTYLGIRAWDRLIVINSSGQILKHKPYSYEIDYFDYFINDSYRNIGNITLYDAETGEKVVEKYLYPSDLYEENDYVSLKIEDNKIYGFILQGDFYGILPIYLYENEYVIYNDEIYYKELNKHKVLTRSPDEIKNIKDYWHQTY